MKTKTRVYTFLGAILATAANHFSVPPTVNAIWCGDSPQVLLLGANINIPLNFPSEIQKIIYNDDQLKSDDGPRRQGMRVASAFPFALTFVSENTSRVSWGCILRWTCCPGFFLLSIIVDWPCIWHQWISTGHFHKPSALFYFPVNFFFTLWLAMRVAAVPSYFSLLNL